MSRNQKIRKEILLQLYGARPAALSPSLITREALKEGLDYTEREIVAECAFLEGQGLAISKSDSVSGAIRYQITSAGILAYENS